MRLNQLALFCGLAILLSSCASTTVNYYPQTLNTWRGASIHSLVERWGHPNTKVVRSDGNVIYIYKTESYHYANTAASPEVGINVSKTGRPVIITRTRTDAWTRGTTAFPCYATFETNRQGQILKTSAQGTGCYGSDNFSGQYSNPNPSPN